MSAHLDQRRSLVHSRILKECQVSRLKLESVKGDCCWRVVKRVLETKAETTAPLFHSSTLYCLTKNTIRRSNDETRESKTF